MLELIDDALAKGTGFPFLAISRGLVVPSPKLDRVLLDHIVHNRVYDPQCEGSRHDYLYEIVCEYSNRDTIFSEVLRHFQTMTNSDDGEYQVMAFVARMVKDGRCSLEQFVEKFESDSVSMGSSFSMGIEEIVDLERMDGILRVARLFGKRIAAGLALDDDWGRPFFEVYAEQFGLNVADIVEVLTDSKDPMVALYFNSRTPAIEQTREYRRGDFDEQLGAILSGQAVGVWGLLKSATEEQFAKYCQAFLSVKDKKIKRRLLLGFRFKKWLGDLDVLLAEYRRSKDVQYRIDLLWAMLPFHDPRCRALVEHLDEDRRFQMIRIQMVLRHFTDADADWVFESLEAFTGHELHDATDFFLRSKRIAAVPIFERVLDVLLRRMHCSICRKSIVQTMIERNLLDQNQVDVLMRDALTETREMVERYTPQFGR
jgi:hypothetical protein